MSELTIFVVDVATEKSKLKAASRYIESAIFRKLNGARKTDFVSVIAVNTDESDNKLNFNGISNICDIIAPPTNDTLRSISRFLQLYQTLQFVRHPNTMFESLLLALEMTRSHVGKRKFIKNIVVLTDDNNSLDGYSDSISNLITLFTTEIGAKLVFVDLSDSKEPSSWRDLASKTGQMLNQADIINLVEYPTPKAVKPVKVFSGQLRLGAVVTNTAINAANDPNCICINVDGYPCTKTVSTLSRSRVAIVDGEYVEVKSSVEYLIGDGDNAQSIRKEATMKAYQLGSQNIILEDDLEYERVYKTQPGLDIRGIINRSSLPRHYLSSETTFILPQNNVSDYTALSAMVDAMISLDKLIVARYVQKENFDVQMVCLAPVILSLPFADKKRPAESGDRAFVLTRLPFLEDLRNPLYPSLTNLKSTSGKPINESSLVPTEKQQAMMDQFVDDMDISSTVVADGTHWLPMNELSNLLLPMDRPPSTLETIACQTHRINNVTRDIFLQSTEYATLKRYLDKARESSTAIVPPIKGKLLNETLPLRDVDSFAINAAFNLENLHIKSE